MTRSRNLSFSGTIPPDADVDAMMFKRVFLEVVQDWHFVYDASTGENGIGSGYLVDHTQAGKGCPLGMQVLSQVVPHVPVEVIGTDRATFGTDMLLGACPYRVCSGDEEIVVEVDATDAAGVEFKAYLMDSAFGVVDHCTLAERENTITFSGLLTAAAAGAHFLVIRAYDNPSTSADFSMYLDGIRAGPRRGPISMTASRAGSSGNPIPITAPGAGVPMVVEPIHDEMIADDYAVAGHIVTQLNRMLNAFAEYESGWPVFGNATRQLVSTSSRDPTTSRFEAHGRKGYANEALLTFPLYAEMLGCTAWGMVDGVSASGGGGAADNMMVDTANPPTTGVVNWHVPYPRTALTAAVDVWSIEIEVPDFPDGVGVSDLVCRVLCCTSGKGTITNWSFAVAHSAGTTAFVAPVQCGATSFYEAVITDVQFYPDRSSANVFTLQMQHSAAAYTFGEIFVVGIEFTFEP